MDTQFSLNNYTSKLPNLVKLCFLPVYSQSCDASGSRVHGDIPARGHNMASITAVFVYYNTGNKEIVDLSVTLSSCKMFSEKRRHA